MRRFASTTLFLLLGACVSSSEQPLQPACENIAPIFADFAGTDNPGFAVAVAVNGEVQCTQNFGAADLETKEPISDATRFNLASVSKALTAWAATSLSASGEYDLDAPLSRYLPDAPAYARDVTSRQMLNHTSGIRDTGTMYIMAGRSASEPISNTDGLALLHRQAALNFPAGDRYLYSNSGYLLTALAMEAATHRSFSSLTQQLVFDPAGLTGAAIMDTPGSMPAGSAKSYVFDGEATVWHLIPHSAGTVGSTNAYASAGDLAKWGLHFLAAMREGDARAQQMVAPARLNDGQSVAYGMGLELTQYRGQTVFMHSGSESGYRSILILLPEKGIVVTVLGNGSQRPQPLAEKVLDVLFDDAFSEPAPRRTPSPGASLDEQAVARLTGFYEFEAGRDAQIIHEGNTILVAVDPFGMLPMEAVSDTELLHAPSQVRISFSDLDGTRFNSMTLTGVGPAAEARRVDVSTSPVETIPTGAFYSEELGSEYELAVLDGTLSIVMAGQPPIPLTALDNGRYIFAPFGLCIEFESSDSFLLSTWRVKNLKFTRRE
ncbi:serine hydrolase domain-containing protein [Hyphomonas sp.]|uniref:serine hydrolase domain-containing protein n=1 Tax=Hyphomonas sp. TaxID=87 RepID=UPI001DD93114|nr:serine hydrolase domain-containing protein [Hyphomonas sp.]MBU4061805.1 beta-lactamase family protein [Alphaproteobacteria bacterium]MBU4163363.1 beta-lactamase family protein [Alphaproteobacteria bacterium]